MGYYSEVTLALTKAGTDRRAARMDALSRDAAREVNDLFSWADRHYVDALSGSEVWHWDWLKWYAEFPEMAFVEDVLRTLEGPDYLFLRLGEEYDDTEIQGCFWDNPFGIKLERSILVSETGENLWIRV